MTTQMDCSIGIKAESTYGTGVTVDQFLEFTDESFDRNATWAQSSAMRVGRRGELAARRSLGNEGWQGSLTVEPAIKGFGILLNAAFGAVTNTAVPSATGAYQQVHTPSTSTVNSYTIQKGIPLIGGATTAMTFLGAVCKSIDFSASAGEIVSVATEWAGIEVGTATAYATPSYPSYSAGVDPLFTFVHGAITIGGTVTNPTTTALATGGTAVANVTKFSLKYEQGLDDGGRGLGGAGKLTRKPVPGNAKVSGSLSVEYDSATMRDAYMDQDRLALVLTFTHDTQIGTGTPVDAVLQLVVPVIVLDNGLPMASNGDPVVTDQAFTGLEDGSSSLMYAVYRTTDTAP